MAKINHEEYKILKSLDDDWEWIARDGKGDGGGNLFAYLEKPFKDCDVGEWNYGRGTHPINAQRFQFIQWKDWEPYSITGLMEEYESGEAEVKDLEWLKEETSEILLTSKKDGTNYFYYRDLKEKIYNAIDQFEEKEKVEVPQFVFDWIGEHKNTDFLEEIHYLESSLTSQEGYTREEHELYFWIKKNFDTFAKAWITYPNIEVKEEEKYYLKIGNLYLAEPLGDMTSDIVRMTRDKEVAYQFTDEKSITTHLDKFEGVEAVKVEELEKNGKG